MNSVELRTIDALIAEVVYQTRISYRAEDDELVSYEDKVIIPFWSTNILCTWDLIHKLQENYYIDLSWDSCSKEWSCRIVSTILPIIDIKSTANTAPLAICKAILELYPSGSLCYINGLT